MADNKNPLSVQEGGGHYKSMKIQPVEFIHANNIPFIEGAVIKYLCRHKNKNGVEDLYKAKRYLDKFITIEEKKVMEKLQEGSKELFDEQMYFALTPHKEMEEGS